MQKPVLSMMGAIKATVKMTEANFYAEDVKVIVKKRK